MTGGLTEGESFGDYRVVRRLGKGGMGEVWLLENATGGRLATKILDPASSGDVAARKRFLREAELALGVSHPNLVEVFDVGEDPDTGLCYILMEYVPGGTLADSLRNGALPVEDAVAVLRAMADVLELGRQKGVVHRDIKPANIMFGADGTPKLADLGIARGGIGGTDTTTVTQTGVMIGTPAYMAPEQMLDAHNVDTRADIYSLGVVFFEMLTGQRPNKDDTVVQLMARAVKGEPLPDVRKLRPEVPAPLAKLLKAMVAPNKDDRIPTPGHITQALDAIEGGGRFWLRAAIAWMRPFARHFQSQYLLTKDVIVPLCVLAVLAGVFAVVSIGKQDAPQVQRTDDVNLTNEEEAVELPKEEDESSGGRAHAAGKTEKAVTNSPFNAGIETTKDVGEAPRHDAPPDLGTKQEQDHDTGKKEDVPDKAEAKTVEHRKPQEPDVPRDALGTMFRGWKTSKDAGVRTARLEAYRGVKGVLCAQASHANVPMVFYGEVDVAGKYPVLCLRLSNHEGDRRCRLCVKIGGKTVREQSITDGWTRIYVRMDAWRDRKVKIELEQTATQCVYWSMINVGESQLLSEFAREQEVGPTLKRKAPRDSGGAADRRKPPQGVSKTCGDLFPGWRVGMGECDYEAEFRDRRDCLVTRSSFKGGTVVMSRRTRMPSRGQFPKPELKLYVTVATRSGGEFWLKIMANGATVYSQDVFGDSWKPLRCDMSAWEGKDVLLEFLCVPKNQDRVCAYWNRIEVK